MHFVVDTSVWVSYFDFDEKEHGASKRFVQGISAAHSVVIPLAVRLELVQVQRSKRLPENEIEANIESILRMPNAVSRTEVSREEGEAAIRLQLQKRLRIGDSLIVATEQVNKATLVTLDGELLELADWAETRGFSIRRP